MQRLKLEKPLWDKVVLQVCKSPLEENPKNIQQCLDNFQNLPFMPEVQAFLARLSPQVT